MKELMVLAAKQHGLFTRTDAHRHGVTDRMLQRRVRSGALEQIATHVYRVCGVPSSWHQDLLAACLAGGPECVASHRSAAALHGFDGFRQGIVEVTVPRRIRYRRAGVIVHQSLDLVDSDCMRIGAIPVTTSERTLIDSGAVVWLDRVEEAFDGAERDRVTRREVLEQRHLEVRRQGRNGVGPMAVCLADRPERIPHSVLERAFLRILERAGIPLPVCQHPVELIGRTVFIDCAYVPVKLGFELDGHGTHATRKQRAADNARAGELADQGWDIRRFTYEQVTREPSMVARSVRAALATRGFGVVRRPSRSPGDAKTWWGGGQRWGR